MANPLHLQILLFSFFISAASSTSSVTPPPSPLLHRHHHLLLLSSSTLAFRALSSATSTSLPLLLRHHSVPELFPIRLLRHSAFATKLQTLAPNRTTTANVTRRGDQKIFEEGVEIDMTSMKVWLISEFMFLRVIGFGFAWADKLEEIDRIDLVHMHYHIITMLKMMKKSHSYQVLSAGIEYASRSAWC